MKTLFAILAASFTVAVHASALDDALTRYIDSVEHADVADLSKVWSKSDEASIFWPSGQAVGLEAIKKHFYLGTMAKNFSKRTLTIEDRIASYENKNLAVVAFTWRFNAVQRKTGSSIVTEGRETQTWILENGRWALLNVHYSHVPERK